MTTQIFFSEKKINVTNTENTCCYATSWRVQVLMHFEKFVEEAEQSLAVVSNRIKCGFIKIGDNLQCEVH